MRGGGGHIMVWGMFSAAGVGPLVRIHGNLNSAKYLEILQTELPPFFHQERNALFMQDNSTPHTAAIVTNWMQQHGVERLPWPANSPDLNPLENLWAKMKRALDTAGPMNNAEQAWQMVQLQWNRIPLPFIRQLITSMPRQVAAVIAAQGRNTK